MSQVTYPVLISFSGGEDILGLIAITEYHIVEKIMNIYFPQFCKMEIARSGHRQIWCLEKFLLLLCREQRAAFLMHPHMAERKLPLMPLL